ncbi:MAG: transketolase [Alphaproteobacteria bacterium]|nr:MAG: transketolase [Alphaproteobacteria bacterium]
MELAELRAAHPEHWAMATALRMLAVDAVEAAQSGHPGMPMGMADVATVLFRRFLRFDAQAPDWPDRDRFVLSAGHGSMLLYGLLHLTGVPGMTLEELRRFRQLGAKTAGHPEYGHAPGIETTTGPLGQGLANAVGMAIAEESLRARFGKGVVDHRTFVIAGDGCLMEGISQEAIALAGRQRLSRLIVLWDDNGISIDGPVSLADATDQTARFRASGWAVLSCDGHDPQAIEGAISAALETRRPTLIACRTRIGFGAPHKEGSAAVHGAPLGAAEVALLREAYGWPHPPFEIPEEIRALWRAAGRRGAEARAAWQARLEALTPARRAEFARVMAGEPPRRLVPALTRLKARLSSEAPSLATRKASELALAEINAVTPETMGGSADLTGSNNTLTEGLGIFEPGNRKGRYIHYGVREHAMAAAMNGMALHGGILPYGGTFLVFSDYARPAMRLSALMGQRVVYVMTHDSIGLGEDGPTHQPVEHLAGLRAIPGMAVFRPADAVETAEAWALALTAVRGPSVLALTRQNLPTLRREHRVKNLSAMGAYVLAEAEGRRQAILLATGSEVSIALEARALLQAEGVGTRVVSMPCWELFAAQEEGYRRRILPAGPVRVGVEAAVRMGWDRWLIGERGRESRAGFVGMKGFGASGPYKDLYAHFGITPQAVAETVKSLL